MLYMIIYTNVYLVGIERHIRLCWFTIDQSFNIFCDKIGDFFCRKN